MANRSLTAQKHPSLSVVFTAFEYSQFENVIDLFRALDRQTLKGIEAIFVVERDRRLYESALVFASGLVSVKTRVIFRPTQVGLSAARNLGIRHSTGELVALFDDDEIPFDDWAEKMVATFSSDEIIGATGPALPLWQSPDLQWLPDELSWLWGGSLWFDSPQDKIVEIRNVGAMNCCFRKEAFSSAGYFLERLGQWGPQSKRKWNEIPGDEVEFSLRVREVTGKKIVYNPLARVYHKVPRAKLAPLFIVKRAYLMGYSKHMLAALYPRINKREPTLNLEIRLVGRILSKFLPSTLRQLVHNPVLAFRRILVVILAVICAGIGYFAYFAFPFDPRETPTEQTWPN